MSLKSFKSNQHDRNILMNFFRHSEEKLQNWCNYGTQDLVRRDRSKCLEWTSELSKKITGSIEPKNDSKCPPNGSHTLKLGLTMSKVINPKNYKVSNESRVHLPEESTIAPIPASWTSFWTTNASNKEYSLVLFVFSAHWATFDGVFFILPRPNYKVSVHCIVASSLNFYSTLDV